MKRFVFILTLLTSPAFADQINVPTTEITTRELQAILDERSKAVSQRFELEKSANGQRFDAQEKAVAAALAAAKEAVQKAETAAEKRFEGLNEFRGTLKDQQATLMPRAEIVALLKVLDEKIQNMEARVNQIISRSEGANWLWGVIAVGLGLLIGCIGAFAGMRWRAP